jgi:hypothetical protein
VVAISRHTETQEELVTCRLTVSKEHWTRPLEMFLDDRGGAGPRFVRVR